MSRYYTLILAAPVNTEIHCHKETPTNEVLVCWSNGSSERRWEKTVLEFGISIIAKAIYYDFGFLFAAIQIKYVV